MINRTLFHAQLLKHGSVISSKYPSEGQRALLLKLQICPVEGNPCCSRKQKIEQLSLIQRGLTHDYDNIWFIFTYNKIVNAAPPESMASLSRL